MRKRTPRRAALGAVGFTVIALLATDASRATGPCPPYEVVRLTGRLIEVRQGDTVIPSEQAILDGVPRTACVSPTYTNTQDWTVTVADCDFAEFSVNAVLAP